MRITKGLSTAIAIAGLCVGVNTVNAAFTWYNITGNSSDDLSGQIQMGVTGSGGDLSFTFHNQGLISSVITEIAFDPGTMSFAVYGGNPTVMANWITESAGVSYRYAGNNYTLPGWNNINPVFTVAVAAEPTPPPAHDGINNNAAGTEWLTLRFTVPSGIDPSAVLNLLEQGQFRVGVHVQGLSGGLSDTYVTGGENAPPTPPAVPEPATVLAGALLLLPFGASAIRIIRKKG